MSRPKSESRAKINKAWAEEARRFQESGDVSKDVEDVPEGVELFGQYLTARCVSCNESKFTLRVEDRQLRRVCKLCNDVRRVG